MWQHTPLLAPTLRIALAVIATTTTALTTGSPLAIDVYLRRPVFAALRERCLHRLVGREENRDLAAGQLRSQLFARLTEQFAVNH
jgi:hypothetical protein